MLYIMAESGKQPQWLAWKHFQLRQHILHVTVDFVIEFSIMFLKVNLIRRCIFFRKNKHILYIEFIYSKNSVIIVTKSSSITFLGCQVIMNVSSLIRKCLPACLHSSKQC